MKWTFDWFMKLLCPRRNSNQSINLLFSLRMGKEELIWFEFAEPAAQGNVLNEMKTFPRSVELDEVSCVVLSLGGLRAARRHWLRRKEDKQQQQLTIPIQPIKQNEWTLLRRQQSMKKRNLFIFWVDAAEERRSKVNGAPSGSAASEWNGIQSIAPLVGPGNWWMEWNGLFSSSLHQQLFLLFFINCGNWGQQLIKERR